MVKRWIAMYRVWKKMDAARCYIESAEDKMYNEMRRCARKHRRYEDFTAEYMYIWTEIKILISNKRDELKRLKLDYESIKQSNSKEPKKDKSPA